MLNEYWHNRQHMKYYKQALQLARIYANRGGTMLDVGTGHAEYLQHYDWFSQITSIDPELNEPPVGANFHYQEDFMQAETLHYDLVLCLQVIEHVSDPAAFLQKLLGSGDTVILSFPLNWPAGKTVGHVNDPITVADVHKWADGDKPVHTELVIDGPSAKGSRMIFVYDNVIPF